MARRWSGVCARAATDDPEASVSGGRFQHLVHRRRSWGTMPTMTLTPRPDAVDDAVLDDLRERLRRFRGVPLSPGSGWDRGVEADYLLDLLDTWAERYHWREHERRVLDLPWRLASGTGGGVPLRAVHQGRAEHGGGGAGVPVVLLHGWPDSVLRFERVLPLLAEAGVEAIVPALPGFPFAAPVAGGGLSSPAMAEVVADALAQWGVARYVLSAGDVGCAVAEALAAAHPDRVAALHLTDVPQHRFLVDPPSDLSEQEAAYVARGHAWQAAEGGYLHEQSTKPHTLAVALGDSPAGLAAWLLEKLRSWTDCDGDVESVFTREELLTWISAYWVSGAIGTSFTPYAESGARSRGRVEVPAALSVFPADLVNAPRSFAERFFDVRSWSEHERGGHFAAWERPDEYVAGVRAALALAAG